VIIHHYIALKEEGREGERERERERRRRRHKRKKTTTGARALFLRAYNWKYTLLQFGWCW